MQAVNEAYELLSDPLKRQFYDFLLTPRETYQPPPRTTTLSHRRSNCRRQSAIGTGSTSSIFLVFVSLRVMSLLLGPVIESAREDDSNTATLAPVYAASTQHYADLFDGLDAWETETANYGMYLNGTDMCLAKTTQGTCIGMSACLCPC